jgi:hypothetical protein
MGAMSEDQIGANGYVHMQERPPLQPSYEVGIDAAGRASRAMVSSVERALIPVAAVNWGDAWKNITEGKTNQWKMVVGNCHIFGGTLLSLYAGSKINLEAIKDKVVTVVDSSDKLDSVGKLGSQLSDTVSTASTKIVDASTPVLQQIASRDFSSLANIDWAQINNLSSLEGEAAVMGALVVLAGNVLALHGERNVARSINDGGGEYRPDGSWRLSVPARIIESFSYLTLPSFAHLREMHSEKLTKITRLLDHAQILVPCLAAVGAAATGQDPLLYTGAAYVGTKAVSLGVDMVDKAIPGTRYVENQIARFCNFANETDKKHREFMARWTGPRNQDTATSPQNVADTEPLTAIDPNRTDRLPVSNDTSEDKRRNSLVPEVKHVIDRHILKSPKATELELKRFVDANQLTLTSDQLDTVYWHWRQTGNIPDINDVSNITANRQSYESERSRQRNIKIVGGIRAVQSAVETTGQQAVQNLREGGSQIKREVGYVKQVAQAIAVPFLTKEIKEAQEQPKKESRWDSIKNRVTSLLRRQNNTPKAAPITQPLNEQDTHPVDMYDDPRWYSMRASAKSLLANPDTNPGESVLEATQPRITDKLVESTELGSVTQKKLTTGEVQAFLDNNKIKSPVERLKVQKYVEEYGTYPPEYLGEERRQS